MSCPSGSCHQQTWTKPFPEALFMERAREEGEEEEEVMSLL